MAECIEKCGNCKWGQIVKQDLTKRLCRGTPPQVVVMPVPGGAQMQFHYPLVEVDGVCALFKPKLIESKS